MRKVVLFICLTLSLVASAEPRVRPVEWAAPIIGSSLDNLYQVDEGLYRSEQPDTEAFADLAKLGIGEVLNLREYHSDDDEAAGSDMALHHIKIDTGAISEEQLVAALDIIIHRKAPILVHCWHGSDRTGAVIAAYRIVMENWSKERAIDELIEGGYGYHANIYPNVVELIQSLDVAKMKSRLGISS